MKSAGVSCLLAFSLALPPLGAQAPAGTSKVENLKILVLNGEGTINNVRQRPAREFRLQINDEGDKPVPNAAISLVLPGQGASGTFANGAAMTTATADAHGQAVIKGFRPNGVAGKLEIAVTASAQGRTGHATITQFNMVVEKAAVKSGHGKLIAIVAVIGAAAAGGAYAGLRPKDSAAPVTPPTPSIVITPGTGTVGPPR